MEKWIHTQANTKTDKQIRIRTNKTKTEIEKIYINNFIKQLYKKHIFENYNYKVIKRETYQTKMYLRPKPDRNKLRNIEIYTHKANSVTVETEIQMEVKEREAIRTVAKTVMWIFHIHIFLVMVSWSLFDFFHPILTEHNFDFRTFAFNKRNLDRLVIHPVNPQHSIRELYISL